MTDQLIGIIGTIAAVSTTLCFSFQCYKVYKTKSTKDISLIMYIVFTIGTANWIIYGYFLSDPIFYSNIITTALSIYILSAKIKYG
jgi:MtN3 and saliva related transmembrane protein